ncbi:hypothetical protein [Paraburkholderia elongata]|uniref:Uncharacterized protein n=1 Tax=Paraburkholderia elongata TaxID=2675747 RepID=A0A972NMY3_9BURK|nr:hypothetical protein [Paraburkholderia elongata]NPT56376.1 hypothetical protein [Paraburkholderia elongata]
MKDLIPLLKRIFQTSAIVTNPTTPQCGIVTNAELVDSNSGITTSVAPPVLPLWPTDPTKTN